MNSGPVRAARLCSANKVRFWRFQPPMSPRDLVSRPDSREYTFGASAPKDTFRGASPFGAGGWKPVLPNIVWKEH
jgi:hypothetical protein